MSTDTTSVRPILDLVRDHIHLGVDASATAMPDFSWSPEGLAAYSQRFAGDDGKGRIVCAFEQARSWDSWERHPAGDEIVIAIEGRFTVIQELPDGERRLDLEPGQALINPAGVWHTADMAAPCRGLFITPGEGTEHRPR